MDAPQPGQPAPSGQPGPAGSPTPPAPAPRRKLTALEARKKYGIRTAISLALFCWFGYDAWLNADPKMQEHHLFNASGAFILAIVGLYSLVMFSSAALTVMRQQKQNPPPKPTGPAAPPDVDDLE